jgi:thioredoxin
MKISHRTGVLSIGVLGLGALIFAGCSTRTQSAGTEAIAQAPQTTTSAQTSETEKTAQVPVPKAIKWEKTLDAALAQAHKTQKPVMIDFFATWCGPCKMLDRQIYPAAPVVQEAQNFVSVKVDVDQQKDLAMKYQIQAMPTIVFLDASGREVHRTQGVSDQASWFVQEMQTARSKISVTAA